MKKLLTIIFISLISVICLSAQTFEGVVDFKATTTDGQSGSFKYYGKGNKIKMEMMSDAMGSVIFDGNNTIILIPSQKSYMEIPTGMADKMDGNDSDSEMEDMNMPTKTNETKNILGYECTKWVYKDGESETELWITDKLGNYIIPSTPMTPAPEWSELFDNKPFFPLMIVTKENGQVVDKMEVTNIEKKSLDESVFTPPADYKKLDMSKMMGN